MALTGKRTYVGFGFGPIQAGLFLYEAFNSGAFGRLVVAEVQPEVVTAVRRSGGYFDLNIAGTNRVEKVRVGPVEIENPLVAPDRKRLVAAITAATEIGTAVPTISHYVSAGPDSLHRLLAEGLRQKGIIGGPRAVIYTAENHNQAAEMLAAKVLAEIPEKDHTCAQARVQFLNTVIGKMSGVISDPKEIERQGLAPITPEKGRAFLVEAFNHILITKIQFGRQGEGPPFRTGMACFEERKDLRPFAEAKFYGHNATHALAAYIGRVKGVRQMAEVRTLPGVLPCLRAACIEEAGAALIMRYQNQAPPFTPAGYRRYADNFLTRMFNPYLRDTVERVGQDPKRKLGWHDRLIGTMRLVLQEGLKPYRYALGAAAALTVLEPAILEIGSSIVEEEKGKSLDMLEALLSPLWQEASPDPEEQKLILDLIEDGRQRLKYWLETPAQELEDLF